MAVSTSKRSEVFPKNNLKRLLLVRLLPLFLVFAFGVVIGVQSWGVYLSKLPRHREESDRSGSVQRLSDIPIRNTSHKDDSGRPITKQQFIEPFHIPNLAGYSVATLLPGQRVDFHRHETMHELFYILEGTGIFSINGNETPVKPGTFIHVAPKELHGIFVPLARSERSLKMIVTGVAV